MVEIHTEGYRSGHNGADSKTVCEKSHMGSNSILSAKKPVSKHFACRLAFSWISKRRSVPYVKEDIASFSLNNAQRITHSTKHRLCRIEFGRVL